jgi:hypothetical protein
VPAKSLGYVVLPMKAVKGSRLRIALTEPTVDRDAFGKIVEVNGARAGLDTGAEKVATGGALGIIEADHQLALRVEPGALEDQPGEMPCVLGGPPVGDPVDDLLELL